MATTGTADNNQSVITRVGNVNTGVQVTNVAIGNNDMLRKDTLPTTNVQGTVTSVNDDVKPRDSDNQLGNQDMLPKRKTQLQYTWAETVAASGYDVHGQIHPNYTQDQTTVTYAADEGANDSRIDPGEWFYRRSKTNNTPNFGDLTG